MKLVRRISCRALLMTALSLVPLFPSLNGAAFAGIGEPIAPVVGFVGCSEENFRGDSHIFPAKPRRSRNMGEFNDWLRSVMIPQNVQVTFFEHPNFKGTKFKFRGEVANLVDHGAAGLISSYKVWHLPVFGQTPEEVWQPFPIEDGERLIQIPITDVDSFPQDLKLEVFDDDLGRLSKALRLVRDEDKFYLEFIPEYFPGVSIDPGETYNLTMKISDQVNLSAERKIIVHTSGKTHPIDWSTNAKLPRVIHARLGESLEFNFRSDEYTNLYYLETQEQLDLCLGSASCFSDTPFIKVGEASGMEESLVIPLEADSGSLGTGIPFRSGGRYYFTSFSNGEPGDGEDENTMGGQCREGLSIILELE